MDVIWDENWRVLAAARVRHLTPEQVRAGLNAERAMLLIADIGFDLQRLSGQEASKFWKEEARDRLVPPHQAETPFDIGDYQGHHCYVASEWTGADLEGPVILLEKHH
jgi:hypothetical protein